MKKISKLLIIAILATTSAYAHNLWVKASNENILKAEFIYADHFPNPESMKKKKLHFFKKRSFIDTMQKKNFKMVHI